MKYSNFISNLNEAVYGADIVSDSYHFGQRVTQLSNNTVLIDGVVSEFTSLEEAVNQIADSHTRKAIKESIQKDLYESVSQQAVVDIIKKHQGDIRVTNTLIESYIDLASSKMFTVDQVAIDIHNLNRIGKLVEGRLDFVLNDGTQLVVKSDTINKIAAVFADHQDVIEYMRESCDNFLNVLSQIEE